MFTYDTSFYCLPWMKSIPRYLSERSFTESSTLDFLFFSSKYDPGHPSRRVRTLSNYFRDQKRLGQTTSSHSVPFTAYLNLSLSVLPNTFRRPGLPILKYVTHVTRRYLSTIRPFTDETNDHLSLTILPSSPTLLYSVLREGQYGHSVLPWNPVHHQHFYSPTYDFYIKLPS